MTPALLVISALVTTTAAPPVPVCEPATELWQVAPDAGLKPWAAPAAPRDKTRAVVLLQGLHLHPIRPVKATRPEVRPWQMPKSELVQRLAPDFDVFALGYAQVLSVDDTAEAAGVRDAVARLRNAGYTEVVLIGHSAGGLIARRFAEVYGTATRVITVAAPYGGVEAANWQLGYRKVQAPFVESLTPAVRLEAMRTNKYALGNEVEIACVVCKLKRLETDGLVAVRAQWTEDLQRLGVPAVLAQINHYEAMEDPATAKTIHELAKGKITRWTPEEVDTARRVLFGDTVSRPNFLRRQSK